RFFKGWDDVGRLPPLKKGVARSAGGFFKFLNPPLRCAKLPPFSKRALLLFAMVLSRTIKKYNKLSRIPTAPTISNALRQPKSCTKNESGAWPNTAPNIAAVMHMPEIKAKRCGANHSVADLKQDTAANAAPKPIAALARQDSPSEVALAKMKVLTPQIK